MNESELLYLAQNNNVCNLTCPHCNTLCKFEINYIKKSKFKISKNIFGVIMSFYCPSCENSFTYLMEIESQQDLTQLNFNFFNYNYTDYIHDKNIKIMSIKQIFPKEKSIAKTFPKFVPEQLISMYDEMCDLLTINPKAATVWARKWIEKFIITKWPEYNNSKTLAQKIDVLSDSNKIDDKDVLEAIRKIGNDSVHIQSIEEDIDISQDDAILGIRLIEDLITEYYVIPEERKRRRADFKALKNQKEIEAKALKQK